MPLNKPTPFPSLAEFLWEVIRPRPLGILGEAATGFIVLVKSDLPKIKDVLVRMRAPLNLLCF